MRKSLGIIKHKQGDEAHDNTVVEEDDKLGDEGFAQNQKKTTLKGNQRRNVVRLMRKQAHYNQLR